MQLNLELLAPARNSDIGTAAIDCGADAVYIAGPAFGARAAAGNPIEEIARLCGYAHTFGARVYATINTLIEPGQLRDAERLAKQYWQAGVDALIIQDMNILRLDLPPVELHASTQSVIRTPERAAELEKAGFTRLILERQLSLDQIRAIRSAVNCELEFFVHGALCVCYSGQCYLSEHITGRSANKGCCAQPCRSRYDLVDADGKMILRDHPVLSLKDYRLDSRIADLVGCGVSSFKIEGRLKNASYVKNVVRHYRNVLDSFIASNPQYRRASFGSVTGGFVPNPDATFNRGYTSAWIDGIRQPGWNSADAAKSMGEYVGEVSDVSGNRISVKLAGGAKLANGDGLSFVARGEEVCGMRAETADTSGVTVKDASSVARGMKVYRNLNLKFERELEKNLPKRMIDAEISYRTENGVTTLSAVDEAGVKASITVEDPAQIAEKKEKAVETLKAQLEKSTGLFRFHVGTIESDEVYFYPAATVNGWRRQLAEELCRVSRRPEMNLAWRDGRPDAVERSIPENIKPGEGELMRMKYCIRQELGLCPKQKAGVRGQKVSGDIGNGPLYLVNRNRKFCLHFDCKNCEMTVSL